MGAGSAVLGSGGRLVTGTVSFVEGWDGGSGIGDVVQGGSSGWHLGEGEAGLAGEGREGKGEGGLAWGSRDEGGKVDDSGQDSAQGSRAADGNLSSDCFIPDEPEWSTWQILRAPWSLSKHNGEVKALLNSRSGLIIPLDSFKLATIDDGTRMFSTKRRKPDFKTSKPASVFGTRWDKARAQQFFSTFKPLFKDVDPEVTKEWPDKFDTAVLVPSDLITEADLPFTLEAAR